MTLKQFRIEKGLTQIECAEYLQIPVRTYKRYEADDSKLNTIKRQYITEKINEYGRVDEEHGILAVEDIIEICTDVFKAFSVEYAYLFGSYAKGTATEKSDVDLLVSVPVDGIKFYELIELLRERLNKKVDLLDTPQLENNLPLTQEILKNGIKIYG